MRTSGDLRLGNAEDAHAQPSRQLPPRGRASCARTQTVTLSRQPAFAQCFGKIDDAIIDALIAQVLDEIGARHGGILSQKISNQPPCDLFMPELLSRPGLKRNGNALCVGCDDRPMRPAQRVTELAEVIETPRHHMTHSPDAGARRVKLD